MKYSKIETFIDIYYKLPNTSKNNLSIEPILRRIMWKEFKLLQSDMIY